MQAIVGDENGEKVKKKNRQMRPLNREIRLLYDLCVVAPGTEPKVKKKETGGRRDSTVYTEKGLGRVRVFGSRIFGVFLGESCLRLEQSSRAKGWWRWSSESRESRVYADGNPRQYGVSEIASGQMFIEEGIMAVVVASSSSSGDGADTNETGPTAEAAKSREVQGTRPKAEAAESKSL
jgi:hypothetical protein